MRHRGQREVSRIAGVDFLPRQRRRYARVGLRSHGIRRGDRPVLRVLVVVEEYTVTLLFPPLAGGETRRATLDLARERKCGATNFGKRPAPLDAYVDVHAPRS